MKKSAKSKQYSTEDCIRKIGYFLARDFQQVLSDPSFCASLQRSFVGGSATEIRALIPAADLNAEAYRFKCEFQMENLLKRFRFQKDLYSDDELVEKALKGFDETQHRIRAIDFDQLDAITKLIVECARRYIHHVLGEYDDDECRERGRFGKKASVGIPSAKACEAERWEPSITGTSQQISWFQSVMADNPLVQNYWHRRQESGPKRPIFQETDVLALTLVPKTFKSLRAIMPNTTLGSYHSYGVGEMIRVRLRKVGYDIRTLQQRHKYLAQLASTCNLYVTADLSSASDSISRELVRRLLPPDWFDVLDRMRIGMVRLPDGRVVQSETFCTMGIGYTFTLQTLIFLSLLKATEAVHFGIGNRRLISVYGDDMIYSARMHAQVAQCLGKLGFVLNEDKTFSDGPFRESCGGDYHSGVDVRPFQPRNGSPFVSKIAYEALLYKYANGLLRRWTEFEVPETLDYICRELASITRLKVVPEDFPDDAGLKVVLKHLPGFLEGMPIARPKHVGCGVFRFSYLRFQNHLMKEERHDPYYWNALRRRCADDDFQYHHSHHRADHPVIDHFELITGQDRDVPSPLSWKESRESGRQFVRSCITGQRLRRLDAYVVVHNTGSYHRQTSASRFEAR